jgi:hypothetical protein
VRIASGRFNDIRNLDMPARAIDGVVNRGRRYHNPPQTFRHELAICDRVDAEKKL